ncbi:phosphoribosyltransferase [Maritimibacter sp. HL-12]|jgi:putative phosphoribosyl transferase|uniref:phosphoribosyltransferase n=1 Tax=Maritimibacter sp. HL-12 TaxID=1162418 RepID=UPI000A0F1C00|nr:phosphoribosyltransferase family protein [Maritimibacter sp. HL-12]SMH41101.1 Predicted phosphoribosyltransferase [Maritimibacter sp. HL-12]
MFSTREDAGEKLAEALDGLDLTDPVVLALPRGGVPVAIKVAESLKAPLDLLLVRKLGAPGNPELAAGAVVDGPAHQVVFNPEILAAHRLTEADFASAIREKLAEIAARREVWLAHRAPVPISGRSVLVVDDGIATGATVRAALKGLAGRGAREIILAVPVAPADVQAALAPLCDRLICLETPRPFYAVGAHFAAFPQVSDDEVTALLAAH